MTLQAQPVALEAQLEAVDVVAVAALHLAFLDHCPNVVVDARASGCKLVVASSGGTKEIVGAGDTIVEDLDWDMKPLDLYSPPPLDYSKFKKNDTESNVDIKEASKKYIIALGSI